MNLSFESNAFLALIEQENKTKNKKKTGKKTGPAPYFSAGTKNVPLLFQFRRNQPQQ